MNPQHQIVTPKANETFACTEYHMRQFPSPYHQHEEIELTAIANSHGSLHLGKQVFPFETGQAFLIGSNIPHMFHNAPTGADKRTWAHSIVLRFRADCFGEGFMECSECEPLHELHRLSSQGLMYEGETAQELTRLLKLLLSAKSFKRLSLFIEIMAVLLQTEQKNHLLSTPPSLEIAPLYAKRIESITAFIYQHLSDTVSLSGIARHCHMNPSALSRFFRKATGLKLNDYIARIRTYEACRQLINTDKPITSIAHETGFENLSSFNRIFRKITDTTPSDYRKNVHS